MPLRPIALPNSPPGAAPAGYVETDNVPNSPPYPETWLSQARIDALHPQSAQTSRYRILDSSISWGGYVFHKGQLLHLSAAGLAEVGAANVEVVP